MALSDVLDTIGGAVKKGAQVAGAVLPEVGQVIGDVADPEAAQARVARQQQLSDQARQARAGQIEQALKTMDEGPDKQALLQQYFDLFPGPQNAGGLIQRLHQIVHPQGAVAQGPMQETLGAPNAGTLAQMLGKVPPPAPKGAFKQGTQVISGADIPNQHDVFGNPTDPKKVYQPQYDATGNVTGLVPVQPRTSGVPRVLPPIAMSAAKHMATLGIPFVDETGEPIDVTKFDNTMQLVPVKVGNHTAYEVTSQGQTHMNVGNQVYAIPRLEQTNLASEGVPLGVARVPTVSTRQTIGVGPEGKPGIQPLTTTATPQTSGVRGAPMLAPVTPATTPADIAAQQPETPPAFTPPSKAKGKVPTAIAPPGPPPAGVTPAAQSAAMAPNNPKPVLMPPGMYNQQLQIARPVRVVMNQIAGDPDNPDFKPLTSYGDVLANPESVKRIANVARMMMEELASAEPSKTGGFWTLLTTNAGLPNALAAAQARQTEAALNKLSPREREFIDAEMDTYGAMSGFRALTKGAASKFSQKNLEREAPLPGFSLGADKLTMFQFYDKLYRMNEEVQSGMKGNAVLRPEEVKRLKDNADELLKLREGARARAPWSAQVWLTKHPDKANRIDDAMRQATEAGWKVVDDRTQK